MPAHWEQQAGDRGGQRGGFAGRVGAPQTKSSCQCQRRVEKSYFN